MRYLFIVPGPGSPSQVGRGRCLPAEWPIIPVAPWRRRLGIRPRMRTATCYNHLMADVISDYQKWKQQGENIRTQAKQAMEARFRELLGEAVALAEEYRADFGGPLKPPPAVTAFRYKSSGRAKAKKAPKPTAPPVASKAPAAVKPAEEKPGPKVAGLQKQLTAAKRKLEEAKEANTPTRKIEDRIYEIEDELRLAGQHA